MSKEVDISDSFTDCLKCGDTTYCCPWCSDSHGVNGVRVHDKYCSFCGNRITWPWQ